MSRVIPEPSFRRHSALEGTEVNMDSLDPVPGANAADIEDLADAGLLPAIRVRAANATQAEAHAHMATGKGVLRVERVEGQEA